MDNFDRMFKFVFGMIVAVFVIIICFWLFMGAQAIKLMNSDCEVAVIVEETNNQKTYSVGCKDE